MSVPNLLDRTARLASGADVPLRDACIYYGLLVSHAADDADLLYHLRQACLGQPLDDAQRDRLTREKYLDAAGTVEPVLKAVALAAIRGEDRALHLVGPFTTHLDRALFEYGHARDVIRTQVDDRQTAEAFLHRDEVQQGISAWQHRLSRGASGGPAPEL